jgi:RND superfamily putative drug exporter
MRESMTKLADFLGRRRRLVLVAWIAVLVLALPIARHQTDHLTGGGFDVPGSESKAVSDSLERNFGESADGIMVLLKADAGSTPRQRAAAVGRVRAAVDGLDRVTLSPAVARRAGAQLQRTTVAMLPLRSDQSSDLLIDSATTLRSDLDPGTSEGGVTTYLAGQPTIWAGMQELSKEDLAKAEAGGFPIVSLILMVVFGS